VLETSAGNDLFVGGSDSDHVDFSRAPESITVLPDGTASGDGADLLLGVERITGSRFADVLASPTPGDSILDGGSEDDTMSGGPGEDTLRGGDGNDFIDGLGGNDSIDGDSGYDRLYDSLGDDSYDGGDGYDMLTYERSSSPVNVDLAQARVTGNGTDTLVGGRLEALLGTSGPDEFRGTPQSDPDLYGGRGDDRIFTFGGNDNVFDEAGTNLIEAGPGNDVVTGGGKVYGGDGDDALFGVVASFSSGSGLFGEAGNDQLTGSALDDILDGGEGLDAIDGGFGNDLIYGGSGADQIDRSPGTGNYGHDTVYAGDGNDLVGGAAEFGWNVYYGESGDDRLTGGYGNDTFFGGPGDDALDGEDGFDRLWGGPDFDACLNGEEIHECEQ
jgi:Ca2+-binding RTX toxin-like protein